MSFGQVRAHSGCAENKESATAMMPANRFIPGSETQ
jgi:hypothetical protein